MLKTIFFVTFSFILFSLSAFAQGSKVGAPEDEAIKTAVLDYIDGWYEGDPERMERALHPELAKRTVRIGPDGTSRLSATTAEELVRGARNGSGKATPLSERRKDITILATYENMDSVRVEMAKWIDFMHLAKIDGRWVIVNALWTMKPSSM